MRLIDADNIRVSEGLVDSNIVYIPIAEIKQQPTAYDVDKVIEQLENEAENNVEFFTDDYRDDYYRGAYAAYNDAIEIVKGGGRDE